MPLNGNGTFTRVHDFTVDAANGENIQAVRFDADLDGIAAALSNAIYRDGQTTITADIPWNGFRLLNLGDATAVTDALNMRTGDGRYTRPGQSETITGTWTYNAAVGVGNATADGHALNRQTGDARYATAAQGTAAATAVQPTRQVNTGVGISGGGDLSSNRTLALTGQALAFHNFAGNGLFARTGPGGFDSRRIVGGDGITVENGDGVSGNPTVSLTTTNRTIIGGGGITVTNGDGAAGNPTVTLSGTFPGTFQADFFSIVNPTGSYWVGADTTGFQNNTSASMRAGRFAVNTGSNDASVFVHNSLNTSASVAAFLFGKQELTVGSIVFTSTGVIYNQTSDRRQKDEISDLSVEDAMAAVRSYQCRTFRWISTGQRDTGFIAQEFATVCPGAVSGDPDGDEMMTMQASNAKTIAEMMRCIQYLLVEIEALKSA